MWRRSLDCLRFAASESDYQVVLDYQREAEELGYGRLR
jgi:hypothetical protein